MSDSFYTNPIMKFNYWLMTSACIVTATSSVIDWTDDKTDINTKVPSKDINAFEYKDGDVGKLYEAFSKEVQPIVGQNGKQYEVLVVDGQDTLRINHFPTPEGMD